jgi:hypothetical protein
MCLRADNSGLLQMNTGDFNCREDDIWTKECVCNIKRGIPAEGVVVVWH